VSQGVSLDEEVVVGDEPLAAFLVGHVAKLGHAVEVVLARCARSKQHQIDVGASASLRKPWMPPGGGRGSRSRLVNTLFLAASGYSGFSDRRCWRDGGRSGVRDMRH
jgi:hypothetical protein